MSHARTTAASVASAMIAMAARDAQKAVNTGRRALRPTRMRARGSSWRTMTGLPSDDSIVRATVTAAVFAEVMKGGDPGLTLILCQADADA